MIGGSSNDAIWIGSGGSQRHQPAHTITRGADPTRLDVALRREVLEECAGVGHDVSRRRECKELFHQDFALLRIGKHRVWIHGLVWSGAIVQVWEQHEVAMGGEPLAN